VSLIISVLSSFGNLPKTFCLFIGNIPVTLKEACKFFEIESPSLQQSIQSSALGSNAENDAFGIAFNLVLLFFLLFKQLR